MKEQELYTIEELELIVDNLFNEYVDDLLSVPSDGRGISKNIFYDTLCGDLTKITEICGWNNRKTPPYRSGFTLEELKLLRVWRYENLTRKKKQDSSAHWYTDGITDIKTKDWLPDNWILGRHYGRKVKQILQERKELGL